MMGHGLENYERGNAIKKVVKELEEDSFINRSVSDTDSPSKDCSLCQGLFEGLDKQICGTSITRFGTL